MDQHHHLSEISINALSDYVHNKTIRICGTLFDMTVRVLIDSGSSHNFILESVIKKLSILVMPITPFRVYVGNGDYITCSFKVEGVLILLQNQFFTIDLFVLPTHGPQLVLGIRWLK